jgi:hypothetical protein
MRTKGLPLEVATTGGAAIYRSIAEKWSLRGGTRHLRRSPPRRVFKLKNFFFPGACVCELEHTHLRQPLDTQARTETTSPLRSLMWRAIGSRAQPTLSSCGRPLVRQRSSLPVVSDGRERRQAGEARATSDIFFVSQHGRPSWNLPPNTTTFWERLSGLACRTRPRRLPRHGERQPLGQRTHGLHLATCGYIKTTPRPSRGGRSDSISSNNSRRSCDRDTHARALKIKEPTTP